MAAVTQAITMDVVKAEHLPDGRRKLILRDPGSGAIVDRIVG
jgi:hypothetical protein